MHVILPINCTTSALIRYTFLRFEVGNSLPYMMYDINAHALPTASACPP